MKVGDLIRPSPYHCYKTSQWGEAVYVRSDAPPCVVTKMFRVRGKLVYVMFHCSWNNEMLMMEDPDNRNWCEVINENR